MIAPPERVTQNRIIKLFRDELHFEFLGSYEDRVNKNIETEKLTAYLSENKYSQSLINRTLDRLKETANNPNESLYTNNKNAYSLIRYGVQVKENPTDNYQTVHLINWDNPEANHFSFAEEVTVLGNHEKRPDIVLYINGIAVAVLELKRSTVSVHEGIYQSITNQQKEFIGDFFGTIQFVFAGNDSEGLRYGTIGTEAKYFLQWKEAPDDDSRFQLDKYLLKMCNKTRILELIHDFVLFDGGKKKLPRVHQYFGIKAAQESIRRREGGIIWHTQGSGKSIVMVLLAKWILENNPNGRVAIITDRDELDKQIKRVFDDAEIEIYRTGSGRDLMLQLEKPSPRLLCSLVHKFGRRDVEKFDEFIEELRNTKTRAVGDLFVFVDECHRTQSGKLHKIMKAMLPNALFIGFTGTPLLKADKATSLEVFGRYIHTYKYNEAVEDKVVLDLMYEARNIPQRISSQQRIDEWFESRTKGLNDFQKSELKRKWGNMQEVLSSRNRMQQIVNDLVYDFSVKPRLSNDKGNAILVSASILDACKYFELLQNTPFRGKCALVTSYNPSHRDIVNEDTGANTDSDKEYIYNTYTKLLENVKADPGKSKAETYEDKAKALFLREPANMKVLVVVAKLLTGFDAPTCTYIYLDKELRDHGLFQAICRVNRLDGDDKLFGFIVDYKELFQRLVNEDGTGAMQVYTSELYYDQFEKKDCEILLKDRLAAARKRLENALEEIALVVEHVPPPKSDLEYIRYFCGNVEKPEELKANEVKRNALYKHTVALIRAYANIAAEMEEAGYSEKETEQIKTKLNNYLRLREMIRKASGEVLNLKDYEADMRFLIDTYIQADPSNRIDAFDEMGLLDIIESAGLAAAIDSLPNDIKQNKNAVAETIINNVRHKIIKEHLIDPAYFEEMSKLLDTIIGELKTLKITYEEFLQRILELTKKMNKGKADSTPYEIKTPAQKALYNNLNKNAKQAIEIDAAVKRVKQINFRNDTRKENIIKHEIYQILQDVNEVERIFAIIKQQSEY